MRRATILSLWVCSAGLISIHALLAESDYTDLNSAYGALISIHALLAESDGPMAKGQVYYINFYPRSPCGERLSTLIITICTALFLSTLSLRRATDKNLPKQSIHHKFLSTLSLRRATKAPETLVPRQYQFLSTLSLRRATTSSIVIVILRKNFYPRSPCGERPDGLFFFGGRNRFLSTLSLRRAT